MKKAGPKLTEQEIVDNITRNHCTREHLYEVERCLNEGRRKPVGERTLGTALFENAMDQSPPQYWSLDEKAKDRVRKAVKAYATSIVN